MDESAAIGRSGDECPSQGISIQQDVSSTEKTAAAEGDDGIVKFLSTWSIGGRSAETSNMERQISEAEANDHMSKAHEHIVIEDYDHFHPTTQELTTKDAHNEVVNFRRKRISVREETQRQVSPGRQEENVASDDEVESPTSPQAEMSKRNSGYKKYVVTNWGVMVGKALWCRMSGQGEGGKRSKNGLIAVAHQDCSGFGREAESKRTIRAVKMAERRGAMVVSQMRALVKRVGRETQDTFDADWTEDALNFLFSADYPDTLMILATGARTVLAQQPSVVHVESPCKVFGDIHGQLRDLLLLFHTYGVPGEDPNLSFVFNGDFVDRGAHQLEVIGVLLALKMHLPDRVFLVRGNHEDAHMNRRYGFQDVCTDMIGPDFGSKAFQLFQKAFDMLPFACVIHERLLVVHGGIGDGRWSLDDLQRVKRPFKSDDIQAKGNEWIFNILWSDPIEEDAITRQDSSYFGVHSSPRGRSALHFGWNVTKTFCALNGLDLIIRSHQCMEEGLGFNMMHENMLLQVFSARDYEESRNDCAVLKIQEADDGKLHVRPQVLRSKAKSD